MPIQYPLVSINGVIGATLSPLDRGFAYGDGLFETCRIFAGAIPLWRWHEERLRHSCERLAIPLDKVMLADYLVQLLNVSGLREGVLKVNVSRGVGGRGYRMPEHISPTYCVAVYEHLQNDLHQQGIAVRVCRQRLALNPSLAGLKHLNRLEQVLARAEWHNDDYAEGLMMDEAGNLIEATASNLFLVRDGQLLTPDLTRCGVAGVMRQVIVERLAQSMALETKIGRLTPIDLESADEVFVCNSVNGIWPVLCVAGDSEINFRRGEITMKLQYVLGDFLRSHVLSGAQA